MTNNAARLLPPRRSSQQLILHLVFRFVFRLVFRFLFRHTAHCSPTFNSFFSQFCLTARPHAQVQLDWIEKTLMGSEADWKGAAPKR